jgi:hypothetical protein
MNPDRSLGERVNELLSYVEVRPGEHFRTSSKIVRGRGRSRASLRLVATAYDFLKEAHPTTVRGVAYRLFTDGIIDSMSKNNTACVSRLLTDAREQGDIPWEWIVDETRDLERVSSWADPKDYIQAVRRSYRRDFWAQQRCDVEVWSEKGTVRGVLAPILNEYGVGFRVLHGFSGATTINDIATSVRRWLYVLYVGDWDPSGLCMSERDLPERLARYGGDRAGLITLQRVALTADDFTDPDLPSFGAETKSRDPRYRWFADTYGDRCWELDAMHPNTLRERVKANIEHYVERESWDRYARAQEAEQETLQAALDSWQVLRGAS